MLQAIFVGVQVCMQLRSLPRYNHLQLFIKLLTYYTLYPSNKLEVLIKKEIKMYTLRFMVVKLKHALTRTFSIQIKIVVFKSTFW